MNAINGNKTYVLAAFWAFGVGFYDAGILTGSIDWGTLLPYVFEGGLAASFRSALKKQEA